MSVMGSSEDSSKKRTSLRCSRQVVNGRYVDAIMMIVRKAQVTKDLSVFEGAGRADEGEDSVG